LLARIFSSLPLSLSLSVLFCHSVNSLKVSILFRFSFRLKALALAVEADYFVAKFKSSDRNTRDDDITGTLTLLLFLPQTRQINLGRFSVA